MTSDKVKPDKAQIEAALGAIQPAIDRLHRYAAHELADKLAEMRVVLTEALAESRRDAARYRHLKNDPSVQLSVRLRHESGELFYVDGENLDREVDNAMKETPL